jgi:mRNA interferase MazF
MARGDIYYANLPSPPPSGSHLQAGTRPCLIISIDDTNPLISIVTVIPFTSNLIAESFPHTKKIYPTPQNGLTGTSIALVFQVSSIDKRILRNKIGLLEPDKLFEIVSILKSLLGL